MRLSCYVPSQIIPKSRVVHLADKQILKRHILSYPKIIVPKISRGGGGGGGGRYLAHGLSLSPFLVLSCLTIWTNNSYKQPTFHTHRSLLPLFFPFPISRPPSIVKYGLTAHTNSRPFTPTAPSFLSCLTIWTNSSPLFYAKPTA